MKQQEISQVHPGLNCFKDGVREIPVDSIPGLKLTGWRPSFGFGTKKVIEETCDPEQLYQGLRSVLNQVNKSVYIRMGCPFFKRKFPFYLKVKNHTSAWPFLKPVDRAEVPDYYDHIKFPMGKATSNKLPDIISS